MNVTVSRSQLTNTCFIARSDPPWAEIPAVTAAVFPRITTHQFMFPFPPDSVLECLPIAPRICLLPCRSCLCKNPAILLAVANEPGRSRRLCWDFLLCYCSCAAVATPSTQISEGGVRIVFAWEHALNAYLPNGRLQNQGQKLAHNIQPDRASIFALCALRLVDHFEGLVCHSKCVQGRLSLSGEQIIFSLETSPITNTFQVEGIGLRL